MTLAKKLLAITVLCLLSMTSAVAACHVITPAGGGSASGADWSNACNGFNGNCSGANLVRGDVYYVSRGNIDFPTLSKANSSSLTITIKSATVADHCTDTGFNAGTHVGQTVSSTIFASSAFWVLDGVYGTEARNTGKGTYGIKITNMNGNSVGINCQAGACSNSTFRFLEIQGNGSCPANGGDVGILTTNSATTSNLLTEHSYFHDLNNDFKSQGTNNHIHQYNIEADNYSAGGCHGENIAFHGANNLTVRYNKIYDCVGTACIATPNGQSGSPCPGSGCTISDNAQFYGNVIMNTRAGPCVDNGGSASIVCVSSILRVLAGENLTNSQWYNNTWANWPASMMVNGNTVQIFFNSSAVTSGTLMKNNIYVNDGQVDQGDDGGASCASNSYFNTSRVSTACSGDQVSATQPLVSLSGNGDFHLTTNTSVWTSLASPFNTDPDGVLRPVATGSRGAFQFTSVTPPSLRILGGTKSIGGLTIK